MSEVREQSAAGDEESPRRAGSGGGDDVPEREIKVTDKRMFTADGELREEYRHIGDKPAARTQEGGEPPAAATAESASAPPPRQPPPAMPETGPAAGDQTPRGAPVEIPPTGAGPAPTFYDLIGMIAEPVTLFLGDATLPDGRSAEDLEMARVHIDLLDVLRQKTAGNLSVQESAVLEDVLYRLRMRYVQKRG